ncbi:putative ribonuclease H-like domain-containing protein [Tanacetum coccineum]
MSYRSDFKFDEEMLPLDGLKGGKITVKELLNTTTSSDAEKKDDESGIDNQEKPKDNDVNNVGPTINTTSINIGSLNINTASPAVNTAPLKDTHADFFGDETEVDMSNISTTHLVPSTPNTRIHIDYSLDNVIGDVQSCVQTRRMTKTSNEQGFIKPKKVIQALKDPRWIKAMQEELLQFKYNNLTLWVNLPMASGPIEQKRGTKNKKYEEIELSIRNKARLFHKMDVKSAFTYGKIEEEVYVCQPLGFEDPEFTDKVYSVEKALYGLHQAPRAWYKTLSTYLLDNAF